MELKGRRTFTGVLFYNLKLSGSRLQCTSESIAPKASSCFISRMNEIGDRIQCSTFTFTSNTNFNFRLVCSTSFQIPKISVLVRKCPPRKTEFSSFYIPSHSWTRKALFPSVILVFNKARLLLRSPVVSFSDGFSISDKRSKNHN